MSSTYLANDKEEKVSYSNNSKIYYSSEFTGTLKCIRKEIYNYSVNSKGDLEYKIDKYVVENEKWQLIP